MEEMKQCPNCGKYVPSDKAYCMGCGTTLAQKCPECYSVLPIGTQICPKCSHSFLRKEKKKKSKFLPAIKKSATPVTYITVTLALLAAAVLCALPSVSLEILKVNSRYPSVISELSVSGYALVWYFLGGHPPVADTAVGIAKEAGMDVGMQFALYGMGLLWIAVLISQLLSVILTFANVKRIGRKNSRSRVIFSSVTLAASAGLFALDLTVQHILRAAFAEYIAIPEGKTEPIYAVSLGGISYILFIISALLFAAALIYHLLVFKSADSEGEKSIRSVIILPMSRAFSFVSRKIRSVFRKRSKKDKLDERALSATRNFKIYLILLAFSLVFTQALRSKVSHIFLWFMLLLPILLLIYILIAKAAVSVYMDCDTQTTEKNQPYTYKFRVDNRSPLSYPFIEAIMSVPQSNSVRCSERSVWLSMAPFTGYDMKNTVSFRFRGTYEIGVNCLYVYDFFKIFKVRIPVNYYVNIFVMPRKLNDRIGEAMSISDSTIKTVKSSLVLDKLEVSDIRDYRMGDSLKSIHWKLSSKSENFIVKDYNTGTSDETVIYCDLAATFPDEAPKKSQPDTTHQAEAASNKKKDRKSKKADKKDSSAIQDGANEDASTAVAKPEISEIDDSALREYLERKAIISAREGKNSYDTVIRSDFNTPQETIREDIEREAHELADPVFYEDMNEFLADGIIELTISSVISELQMGHVVTLVWFDRRADGGFFSYRMRGEEEFEKIYREFATAPLTDKANSVFRLTSVTGEIQSSKHIFVTSAIDSGSLGAFSALSSFSNGSNSGTAEIILYDPAERFMNPQKRSIYINACRERLSEQGISLIKGSIKPTDTKKSST